MAQERGSSLPEQFAAALCERVNPAFRATVDQLAVHAFIDVALRGTLVDSIQWSPVHGFGFYADDYVFGENPEVWVNTIDEAIVLFQKRHKI